jgi:hypothetical protein
MAAQIGLYFPYMHFRDEAWLKLSMLYWDRMARISPEGYSGGDSRTVRELVDAEYVRNISPGMGIEKARVGRTFMALIQARGPELRKKYDVDQRYDWPQVAGATNHTWFDAEDPRLRYVLLDIKVDTELSRLLIEENLAIRAESPIGRWGTWIGMHPKLEYIYMAALAEEMARRRGFQPLADREFDFIASTGWTMERLAHALLDDNDLIEAEPTASEVEEVLATIALQCVVPQDIGKIPVEKLLLIREQYAGGRAAFQQHLHELASSMTGLQSLGDAAAVRLHLETAYETTLKPQLDELKEGLRGAGFDALTSLMTMQVSVPAALTSGAALFGAEHLAKLPPSAVGAGTLAIGTGSIALALSTVRHKKQQARKDLLKNSPVSYLLNVQSTLSPTNLNARISSQMRRFQRHASPSS